MYFCLFDKDKEIERRGEESTFKKSIFRIHSMQQKLLKQGHKIGQIIIVTKSSHHSYCPEVLLSISVFSNTFWDGLVPLCSGLKFSLASSYSKFDGLSVLPMEFVQKKEAKERKME